MRTRIWILITVATVGALSISASVGGAAAGHRHKSIILGSVAAGPTCPVERPGRACGPRPVSVKIVVTTLAGRVVASTTSDERGTFSLRLAPGQYVFSPRSLNGAKFPRGTAATYAVAAKGATRIRLRMDTGIR